MFQHLSAAGRVVTKRAIAAQAAAIAEGRQDRQIDPPGKSTAHNPLKLPNRAAKRDV
jgi:hypothetical protein